MSIAKKLKGYEEIRESARYKEVEVTLGAQTLKLEVRIPLRDEMEKINRKIAIPSQELIDAQYVKLTKELDFNDPEFAKVLELTKTFTLENGEIFYEGKNVKVLAFQLASYQIQVEEYFKLIKSHINEPITESFEEIAAEFTDEQIGLFIKAIGDALSPKVDEVKKN